MNDKYCTRELAKRFAGRIKGVEDDDLLEVCIFAASRYIDDTTHRYYGPSAAVSGEVVEKICGSWASVIYTQYAPIISVTSLEDDVRSYTEGTQFYVSKYDGRIELLDAFGRAGFSSTPGKLTISYLTGQGSALTGKLVKGVAAPYDIQVICAQIAAATYKNIAREGIASRQEGEKAIMYRNEVVVPVEAQGRLNLKIRYLP